MIIHDVEQGSAEWFILKMGRFSGSNFSKIVGAKTNKGYTDELYRVVGEVLTGKYEETYKNKDMERGNEEEPIACKWYENKTGEFVDKIGFVEHSERVGFSPDGFVNNDGMIEIKTAKRTVQIARLYKNKLPSEHRWQVQGGLWVCEREWCDFVSYNPELDKLIIRVYRDEKAIKELQEHLEVAINEVNEILTKLEKK